MTLSVKEQRDNQAALIVRLLDAVGDKSVQDIDFTTVAPEYVDIFPTSWVLLTHAGYLTVEEVTGPPIYQLTPDGWLRALELTHRLTARGTVERAQKVLKAIKCRIDRYSHDDAIFEAAEIAQETELPEGWVHNVLSAGLLNALFPGRGYTVRPAPYHSFCASPTFGHSDETAI
jgi:hypothetical protein